MTEMRFKVDFDKCIGGGQCVRVAPELFDQDDDDGTVIVLTEAPTEAQRREAVEAVEVCPARALELVDDTAGV